MNAAARAAAWLIAVSALSACDQPTANRTAAPQPPLADAPPAAPVAVAAANTAVADPASERPALSPVSDYVLPGALAPDLGTEQLRELFGAANVRIDDHLPLGEGEEVRGVVLYSDDATRRAYVYFQDPQRLRGLSAVSVRDAGSRWRLDNGLRMGLSLAELARLNGKPILFSGLDWGYGGQVQGWNGGALGSRDGDPLQRQARLDYTGSAPIRIDDYPSGDRDFSSDDPRYPNQGRLLSVVELGVSFPGEDDL